MRNRVSLTLTSVFFLLCPTVLCFLDSSSSALFLDVCAVEELFLPLGVMGDIGQNVQPSFRLAVVRPCLGPRPLWIKHRSWTRVPDDALISSLWISLHVPSFWRAPPSSG